MQAGGNRANPFNAPEITVLEVAELLDGDRSVILMDVREDSERALANLGDEVLHIPLSRLANEREAALPAELSDKDKEIIIFCHTGVRSAQVTVWMKSLGWTQVWSMAGGIDAYARLVDPSVGFYR